MSYDHTKCSQNRRQHSKLQQSKQTRFLLRTNGENAPNNVHGTTAESILTCFQWGVLNSTGNLHWYALSGWMFIFVTICDVIKWVAVALSRWRRCDSMCIECILITIHRFVIDFNFFWLFVATLKNTLFLFILSNAALLNIFFDSSVNGHATNTKSLWRSNSPNETSDASSSLPAIICIFLLKENISLWI